MARIEPFCAIRPREDLADKIAALPYDVYNREEAKREVAREPLSFLKIDRAETGFPDDVDTYDERVYQKASEILWDMVEKGEFIQDEESHYYIYELTMNGRVQTGIVACAAVDDYESGVIKKHENTRADKEVDRIHHVDTCNAQTGPIFLAYRNNQIINDIVETVKTQKPLYDFTSPDGIRHRVFRVDRARQNEVLRETFKSIHEIYIADGHHRCASAVKVSKMRREKADSFTGEEAFNTFLSVLFPDNELMIMDYNRVVKDLNGKTEEEFLEEIQKSFVIEESEGMVKPEKKGEFGMYLGGKWSKLTIKQELCSADPVEGLDVSLLQKYLLDPVLGIKDPKTDQRIDFVGGIRGLEELKRRVQTDCKVAFSMYPTDIHELFAVADADLLMPPKSTWFEPKLRSGLFIHSIR